LLVLVKRGEQIIKELTMPNVALIEIVKLAPFSAICTGVSFNGIGWVIWGKWSHMIDYL